MVEMMTHEEIKMEMLENEGMFTISDDENIIEKIIQDENIEEIIKELIINYDEFELCEDLL